MEIQPRSGKEVSISRVEKKEMSEEEEEKETGEDNIKNNSECIVETQNKVHTEQRGKNCEQKQKEKVPVYMPAVPFPQRL